MARILRGSRQGRFPTTNRRRTGWEIGPGESAASTFTGTTSVILGSGAQALQDGLTIVRVRGNFQAFLTAGAAGDGFHCALGMAIVSVDAFAIGVTAVPNPIADMDWGGWLYHRFYDVHCPVTFVGRETPTSIQFQVDSKAMRKIGVNEVLFMGLEMVEIGTSSMTTFFESRILLKLP